MPPFLFSFSSSAENQITSWGLTRRCGRNTGAESSLVIMSGGSRASGPGIARRTHGVTAWKTALGSVFTASCPPFASCYVLLPTLYLVPVRFPIPRCGLVLPSYFYSSSVHFYFFCLLYTILVRSPTPDHLLFSGRFSLFLCCFCALVVNLKCY